MQNVRTREGENETLMNFKKMIQVYNIKLIKTQAQRYSFDFDEDDQSAQNRSDQKEVEAGKTLLSCKRSSDKSPYEQIRGNSVNPFKAKLRNLLGSK